MTLEKILKAYLFTYWPETGALSKSTGINYSQIEIRFDESKLYEDDLSFHWEYKDIGSASLDKPVDFVKDNILDISKFIREQLAKKGKLDLSKNLEGHCFLRINNLSEINESVISACDGLLEGYVKAKKEAKGPKDRYN